MTPAHCIAGVSLSRHHTVWLAKCLSAIEGGGHDAMLPIAYWAAWGAYERPLSSVCQLLHGAGCSPWPMDAVPSAGRALKMASTP